MSAITVPPEAGAGSTMAGTFRYAAFLSYASKDAVFAKKLHAALEGYRIPASLGHFNLAGHANRVYPVFRDREELAAGSLGGELEAALQASNALIVVCSPQAAASTWVNTEIRNFRSLGRGERILAIIVDGEPNSSARGRPDLECFPAALLEGTGEPLAADARQQGDGFRNAWLKIVAGLVSVNAGALQDRDRQRRRRRALLTAAGAVGLLAAAAIGVGGSDRAASREDFTARATLLTERGERVAALPFALAGLGGNRPRAEAALNLLGGRLPLIGVLTAPTMNAELQFSPDGKALGARSANYEFTLWDTRTGKQRGSVHSAESFSFADGSDRVVLTMQDHFEVIDAGTGDSMAKLGPFVVARNGDSLAAAGRVVAGQVGTDRIGAWDARTGRLIATLVSPGVAAPVQLSTSGHLLLGCDEEQRCVLWDVPGARKIAVLKSVLGDAIFSADDERMAARSGYDSVQIWDARTGQVVKRIVIGGEASAPIMSADGSRLVVAADRHAQLWDPRAAVFIADMGEIDDRPNPIAFSTDGRRLTILRPNATGALWDAASGKSIADFTQKDSVNLMQISPEADRLIIQSFDRVVTLRDGATGRSIAVLGPMDTVESAVFSSVRGPFLIRTLDAGTTLWTHDGQKIADFGARGSELDFSISHEGDRVVGFAEDGRVELWDSSRPLASGEGVELRAGICKANGNATPAFRREDRKAGDVVAGYLKGRPWQVCRWRDLRSAEGWLQAVRYWAARAGMAPDYRENE
jgi:WD40 repeat protein